LDSSWKDPAKKPLDMSRKPEKWEDPKRLKQAYEMAISNANQLQSTVQTQGMEAYEYSRLLRLSEVEIWKKYAQALACFILFFIGAPIHHSSQMGVAYRQGFEPMGCGTVVPQAEVV
jgi:lipopolysaccharide export LptBFGC system permease protein LptF